MRKGNEQEKLLDKYVEECLKTKRWRGDAVLMVVDAAFDSIGLSYFNSVVPKVKEFREKFPKIRKFSDLANADTEKLLKVWKNKRSWQVAKSIAAHLSGLQGKTDSGRLKRWAEAAPLEGWDQDPIGAINGVGLVTYQYLRMMGGVDTIMPDKIVKRFVARELGIKEEDDLSFVKQVEQKAKQTRYRPIEWCWLSWLVESDGNKKI